MKKHKKSLPKASQPSQHLKQSKHSKRSGHESGGKSV
jgi:hypothetical protein